MRCTLGLWSWMEVAQVVNVEHHQSSGLSIGGHSSFLRLPLCPLRQLLSYLRLDAQEVSPLSAPELDLHSGARVVSSEQQCTRVFFQDIPYLKRPLHCQTFHGVQQPTVQGPPAGAEGHRAGHHNTTPHAGASERKTSIPFCQVVNFIIVELLAFT